MWIDCGREPKTTISFHYFRSESSDISFLLVITHRLFHLEWKGKRFFPAVEIEEVGKVLKQRLKPKGHSLSSWDAQELQWSRFRLMLFKRRSGSIIWDQAVLFSQPYCSFTSDQHISHFCTKSAAKCQYSPMIFTSPAALTTLSGCLIFMLTA